MISPAPSKGFSLVEIMMVLVLIGIMGMLSLDYFGDSAEETKFDNTVDEMNTIAKAIVGDKSMREGGTRTSFGYFGDVGSMPSAIGDLTTKPGAVSAYTISSTTRTAYGWNGPYLASGAAGIDYTTDAWGNAYVYSPAASPATLVSLGSDGAAGGAGYAQDITISMPTNERWATVEGFVSSGGRPYTASAAAQLNYPNGTGGLTQSADTNLDTENGHFSYASVPMGVRSITIYRPTIAGAVASIGPFIVTVDRPNFLVPTNQLEFNP